MAELSRRLGTSRQSITARVRNGRMTAARADGLYEFHRAQVEWIENRERPPSDGTGGARKPRDPDATDWKAKHEKEKALKARLARRALQGRLVRREVVDRQRAESAALLRSHLDGVGKSLRDRLAAETNARRCGDMVDKAIRDVLNQLSKDEE